jgi:hypothetical protein
MLTFKDQTLHLWWFFGSANPDQTNLVKNKKQRREKSVTQPKGSDNSKLNSRVTKGVQWRFVWRFVYCRYFERTDPDSTVWPSAKSIEDVIARLNAANTRSPMQSNCSIPSTSTPPYDAGGSGLNLDWVSVTCHVSVMHASDHIMNVRTRSSRASLAASSYLYAKNRSPLNALGIVNEPLLNDFMGLFRIFPSRTSKSPCSNFDRSRPA